MTGAACSAGVLHLQLWGEYEPSLSILSSVRKRDRPLLHFLLRQQEAKVAA